MESPWTLADLSTALACRPLQLGGGFAVNGFSIDSRSLKAGELFICLKGEKQDGHAYIQQALAAGASGLLIEDSYVHSRRPLPPYTTIFCKPGGIAALQALAAYHRKRLSATCIGVTGSNGKTSTKEMLAGLLQAIVGKEKISSTPGNLNNHIGLPLSLLRARPEDRYIILEMGMNHAGEISLLSQIAKPDHAIISCVAGVHCEFFANIDAIVQAKLEILEGMPAHRAHLAYHAYSPGTALAQKAAQARAVELHFFGIPSLLESFTSQDEGLPTGFCQAGDLELSLEGLQFVWQGRQIHCRHLFHPALASNLVGCFCLLSALGLSPEKLQEAAAELRLQSKRRFELIRKERQGLADQILIDDSYNANPASFASAIEALRRLLPGGRLALFMGEMGELGETAREGHCQVGRQAAQAGYSLLGLQQGDFSEDIQKAYLGLHPKGEVLQAPGPLELAELLEKPEGLSGFDGILVKGSRCAQMELLSDHLRQLSYV